MTSSDAIGELVRRGLGEAESGRPAQAVATLESALALAPGDPQLLYLCGLAARLAGQQDLALERLRATLGRDPGHEAALGNLAELAEPDEAIRFAEAAIAAAPGKAALHFRLGTILNRAGRGAEALAPFARAIALDPRVAAFHTNQGVALRLAGKLAESVDAFDRALALKPGDALAQWNRALSLLGLGRLAEGWRDYERRLDLPSAPRPVALPRWDGTAGRRVLVQREQGLGDELLFANCLPDLLAVATAARVECDHRLAPLYRRSFAAATILPVRRPDPGAPEPAPQPGDAEAAIALGSLPLLFRPSLASFPAARGYLRPDPARGAHWRGFLDRLGRGRKIGLCWRSSQIGGTRDSRYARIGDLADALSLPGIRFVSLQLNLAPVERELAAGRLVEPPGLDLRDDVDGTAALIAALDRVITIDSWILSLAGALGQDTVFLSTQRDWATLGSDGVPWAPSVRLLAVEQGGWRLALERAAILA